MARWIRILAVVATVTGAVVFFALMGRTPRQEDKPASHAGRYLEKLGIERSKERTAAPDFVLEDSAGKRVSLRELRGKVVFLNFWATWCSPCIQEMPTLENLHRDLGNAGLVMLAINFQESPEQVKQFLREHSLTFTALLDRDGTVFQLYQAWALPMSAIVNKRGDLVGKAMGYRNWHSADSRQLFQKLLTEE